MDVNWFYFILSIIFLELIHNRIFVWMKHVCVCVRKSFTFNTLRSYLISFYVCVCALRKHTKAYIITKQKCRSFAQCQRYLIIYRSASTKRLKCCIIKMLPHHSAVCTFMFNLFRPTSCIPLYSSLREEKNPCSTTCIQQFSLVCIHYAYHSKVFYKWTFFFSLLFKCEYHKFTGKMFCKH